MDSKSLRRIAKQAKEKRLQEEKLYYRLELDKEVQRLYTKIQSLIDGGIFHKLAQEGCTTLHVGYVGRFDAKKCEYNCMTKYDIYLELTRRYSKYKGHKIRLKKVYVNDLFGPIHSGYKLLVIM